jgi:hypothetical protein
MSQTKVKYYIDDAEGALPIKMDRHSIFHELTVFYEIVSTW